MQAGTRLAAALIRACGSTTVEGTIWPVDAALRPEGNAGPLVRRWPATGLLQRWAKTWEFQALLKARPVAGDIELGSEYVDAVEPMVWPAASRPEVRRRRAGDAAPGRATHPARPRPTGSSSSVPAACATSSSRCSCSSSCTAAATRRCAAAPRWIALDALSAGGYVGRERRRGASRGVRVPAQPGAPNPAVPAAPHPPAPRGRGRSAPARPLARLPSDPRASSRGVAAAHPRGPPAAREAVLPAAAGGGGAAAGPEARLTPEAARQRLVALGYVDPAGALRHLEALTDRRQPSGGDPADAAAGAARLVRRRADPDARAARVPSGQRRARGDALVSAAAAGRGRGRASGWRACWPPAGSPATCSLRQPEAVATARRRRRAAGRARRPRSKRRCAAAARRPRAPEAGGRGGPGDPAPRAVPGGRADVLGLARAGRGRARRSRRSPPSRSPARSTSRPGPSSERARPLTRFAVIGMGRLGGHEQGYGSDADVLFVHEARVHGVARRASRRGRGARRRQRAASAARRSPAPTRRSASTRICGRRVGRARWSGRWPRTRRTTRAGRSPGRPRRCCAPRRWPAMPSSASGSWQLVDPLRWPGGGVPADAVREIRRIKARVEAERLPARQGPEAQRQARPRRAGRCRVDRAAAPAPARRRPSGAADHQHTGRAHRRGRARADHGRRRDALGRRG